MKCVQWQERTITMAEQEYPSHLRQVRLPPARLVARGPLIPASGRLLTVTGSAEPSPGARRIAYEWGLACARCRVHLVLSNASGIARHALYGAWEGRCETVVVFDTPLPRSGWAIPSAILVTPFMDTRIDARSRALSAASLCGSLGVATVVIQAPRRGLSLEVAQAALDGGREVFVHEVGVQGEAGCEGSRSLAEMGAPVISCYEEIAHLLGWQDLVVV